MARRSQCSSAGDNPLDPNYLPPHYREEYRLAIDALVEEDLEGYYKFLQIADVVDFLSTPEIQYIQSSVQVPQQSHYSENPEQRFLDVGDDGSSDTYWPIHSDLDAPGLDLGWPQLHHFIGPTEVTTLVNPPASDMPSIKDQARRLIKNAQQVIAIVMDMFTDVDMFADIINAAMRNVAVYIILDEQNAHHFVNMVSNCRVNLQSIQFLRVRTVSGITYHCRSGKSFKGQMMDRFLLTDCRAVLSGNYSFMWSFEKLHRCMAHLFLGQLVSTFDEEFRILFAQSQPLILENVLLPVEDFNILPKSQYPSEKMALYRESRKLRSMDTHHPDEWARHSYDERIDVDWKMIPLKKQESLHGPSDLYSRFPSQQQRMDPSFDQGPSRIPMQENPAFQRHSYAEGGHGRFPYSFLQQQGTPEPENHGRQYLRGQQHYPGTGPAPEADYSGYDKFWSQDYPPGDQNPEPQEVQPPHNFDSVFNYLSSTRNVDFEQSSEKLLPATDLPFSSSHPRRLSLGQPYACQTSPTPSNPTDQKQFFQEPNVDRKDPRVKRGLRNWRITSYLSAYDNPDDEGMPSVPPQTQDPIEEPSYPIQKTLGIDLSVPKIPNVREFKVPAVPRASQMPAYAKITAHEQPKKLPDESTAVAVETKTAPTPSESLSMTDMEKAEEAEQKEPKKSALRREESFRRKYNAAAPRSSRLRSSLIFSSLDQQQSQETTPGQQDGESDKNEGEQTKSSFASQVLGQRRSAAREPSEWIRYIKSNTEKSKPEDGNSKTDDKDPSKDIPEKGDSLESLKPADVQPTKLSPSLPQSKPTREELPKTDQPVQPLKSLLITPSYLDMNDPDNRLMFFKELAAKRKAAMAAEADKNKDKVPMKPPSDLKHCTTVKNEEPEPKQTSEKVSIPEPAEADKSKDKDATKPQSELKDIIAVKNEPETKQTTAKVSKPEPVEADKSKDEDPSKPQSDLKDNITVKNEGPEPKQTSEKVSKPEPAEADKSKDKDATKAQSDLKDSISVKIEEPEPNQTSEKVSKPLTSEADKNKDKVPLKPPSDLKHCTTVKNEQSEPKQTTGKASKPEPAEADKSKDKDATKAQSDLKDSISVKIEEPEPNQTSEKVSKPLTSEADKNKDKVPMKPASDLKHCTTVKNEQSEPKQTTGKASKPEPVEVDKSKNEDPTNPQSDLKDTITVKNEEPEPKPTLGKVSNTETSEVDKSKNEDPTKPPTDIKDSITVKNKENEPKQTPEKVFKPEISEADKSKDKDPMKPPTDIKDCVTVENEENEPKQTPEKVSKSEPADVDRSKDNASMQAPTDLKDSTIVKKEASEPKESIKDIAKLEITEAEKTKDKTPVKAIIGLSNDITVKIAESKPKGISEIIAKPSLSEGLLEKFHKMMKASESVNVPLNVCDKTNTLFSNEPSTFQSCEEKDTRASAESHKTELKNSQLGTSLMGFTERESPLVGPPEELMLSKPVVKQSSPSKSNDESPNLDFTSKDLGSLTPRSLEVQPTSESVSVLDSYTHNIESAQLENVISSHSLPSLQHTGSGSSFSDPPVQSSSSCNILLDSSSQISPSHPTSSLASVSTPAEHISSNDTTEFSNSNLASIISPLNFSNADAEFVSPSLQESSTSAEEMLRKSEVNEVNLDAIDQLTSPETPSEMDLVHVKSDTCHNTSVDGASNSSSLDSTTKTNFEESCSVALSEKVLASENCSDQKDVSGSSKDRPLDSTPSGLSPSSFGSGLPEIFGSEGSKCKSDQNETISLTTNQEDPPAVDPDQTVDPDVIPFQSETLDSPQKALIQATSPSEHNLIRSDTNFLAETELCSSSSPPSVESVVSPETDKNENSIFVLHSPSDTNSVPKQITTDSSEPANLPSTETLCPTELTSEVPAEPDVLCQTPGSVAHENYITEPLVSAENSKIDNQREVELKFKDCQVTSDEVLPRSPQSKQPKSSQSRYHASTANVLSGSNLRDDTKLLLEQISANSQSRNETTKKSPVTDDDKEDEADKNAKREKERGIRAHGREQPKSTEEREKVLERIQNMRNQRRVYSRFEV